MLFDHAEDDHHEQERHAEGSSDPAHTSQDNQQQVDAPPADSSSEPAAEENLDLEDLDKEVKHNSKEVKPDLKDLDKQVKHNTKEVKHDEHTKQQQRKLITQIKNKNKAPTKNVQGTKLKSVRKGCNSVVPVVNLRVADTGADKQQKLSDTTISDIVMKISEKPNRRGTGKGAVTVKVKEAPSRDHWTKAACSDPHNRSCTAWIVNKEIYQIN